MYPFSIEKNNNPKICEFVSLMLIHFSLSIGEFISALYDPSIEASDFDAVKLIPSELSPSINPDPD